MNAPFRYLTQTNGIRHQSSRSGPAFEYQEPLIDGLRRNAWAFVGFIVFVAVCGAVLIGVGQ